MFVQTEKAGCVNEGATYFIYTVCLYYCFYMWLLSALSGVISAISYRLDSVGIYIAVLSFSIMFIVCLKQRTFLKSLWVWLFFGISYYITSLFWINEYLSEEYRDTTWLRWGIWPLLIIILSLSFTFIPLLTYRLSRSQLLVALPFVLTLMDILREQTSFSFPWLHPGLLLLDVDLAGWLSVVGAFGGGFLVYSISSLFAWLVISRNRPAKAVISILGFTIILSFLNQGFQYYGKSPQNFQVRETVRVLHGNFSGEQKLSKNGDIERIKRYVSLSLQAPRVDLVIWPESSMSFPYTDLAPFVSGSIGELVDRNITAIWGGQARNGQDIHNVIYRSDQKVPIYYKQRLVPFGEYRPAWFVDLIERVTLSRGRDIQAVPNSLSEYDFGTMKAVMAVCYEALYSDVFISKLESGAVAFLLGDVEWTNSYWVKQFLLRLSRVRATEIGKSVIYSTNQGHTSFISPNGIVERQVATQSTQYFDAVIPLVKQQTFYTQHGHQWLLWLCAIVVFLVHSKNLILNSALLKLWAKRFSHAG